MEAVGAGPKRKSAWVAQAACIVAVVLLIRLPFLNQAVQGDDVYYLAGAQYAQIDPLHPHHARYVFGGVEVSMRGHPHPPLNVWFLAALLAAWGGIREVPFHAAYTVFSLTAALSMLSLARRFSPRPLLATLLFLAVPAFVVNGNSFEADLPFLACWMAAAAAFVRAVDGASGRWLAAAAAALALAALAAYQSVLIVPILAVYLWINRRTWRAGWGVLLAGPLVLGLWQLYEHASSGELPLAVAAGYFQAYGLQSLANKLKNAGALTGHTGWLLFPALAVAAFRPRARVAWLAVLGAAAAAAWADAGPLFWASAGVGSLVIVSSALMSWKDDDHDVRFLSAWLVIFFAGALALFFAGSARYLLPMAAPVALLASKGLAPHPIWLASAAALQLAFSLCLSVVNYQHWDGYREFARALRPITQSKRVWVNGEWGLRYYLETDGGLPLVRGQAVEPGEFVASSELGFPVQITTGGGALTPVAEREITSAIPLRLSGLGARSAYSSISLGLRPFDIHSGPIDRVRASVVVERKPVLSYLPMNAPEAGEQILSGLYQLEGGRYRWMASRAVLLLSKPAGRVRLEVGLYIPEMAPARRVWVSLNGLPVAGQVFPRPGTYTLESKPLEAAPDSPSVTIEVDRTFTVPGDQRQLGVILTAAGFKPVP